MQKKEYVSLITVWVVVEGPKEAVPVCADNRELLGKYLEPRMQDNILISECKMWRCYFGYLCISLVM